jgi:GNAT superfamily N-acetyltransferase
LDISADLRQKGNAIVDLRIAQAADIPAIEDLIARSVMELMKGEYSAEQRRASIGPLFGVDRQIIEDGTYYVMEEAGKLVGSGGWSFRRTLFGGDAVEDRDDTPNSDAAHIRAYYVDPGAARTGIATRLLMRSETDARARGFTRFEMAATLTGRPFYTRHGYQAGDKFVYPLPGGLEFPLVYMGKTKLP